MDKSTVDKVKEQRQNQEKEDIIKQQERNEWKEALNRIAETPDGEMLFKKLVKFVMPFADLRGIDPQTQAEINGSRAFYFKYIRPYLDKPNITKVE